MNGRDRAFLLKLTLAVTMLAHSVPGMMDGGVNACGRLYLDPAGFAPFGLGAGTAWNSASSSSLPS